MPTVVVETGSLIAGANSYVTRADVVTYCDNRGYAWAPASDAVADRAVIKAGDWLKNTTRLVFRGSLRTATQTMPWPRTGASLYRGPAIDSDVIPQCLKDAQCELAYRILAGTDVQPDLDRGGRTKREKVDVIEVEYFEDAPSEVTIQAVMGILQPILLNNLPLYIEPYQAQPVDKTPYLPGEFDNPPIGYDADPSAIS